MRDASLGQVAALEALHADMRVRVEARASGSLSWVDLSSWRGIQWIRSVRISSSEERTVVRAVVRVARESGPISLSPLVAEDPALLAPGGELRISVDVREIGGAWTGWVELLEGYIDDSSGWTGEGGEIEVQVRDKLGATLHDTYLEEPIETPAGDMEDVLRAILDEAAPEITLLVEVDLTQFVFPEAGSVVDTSLEAALWEVVSQAGWLLVRRWIPGTGYALALIEPPDPSEEDPVPDATLQPRAYYEVPAMGASSIGVRDAITIRWEVPDAAGTTETRSRYELPAPLYPPRYRVWPLDERRNPLMRTQAAVDAFGRRALAAASRTPLVTEAVLPPDWRWELSDVLGLEVDGETLVGQIVSTVLEIEATQEGASGETRIQLAGYYRGPIDRWIERVRRTRRIREIEDVTRDGEELPPLPPFDGEAALYYTTGSAGEGPGFADESERETSLGSWVSTTRVRTGLGGLFRDVTQEEADAGIELWVAIAIANGSETVPWPAVRGWVAQVSAEGVSISIGADPAGVVDLGSETVQGAQIPDAETAPAGVSVSAPDLVHEGIVIGHLAPQSARIVWVRLQVDPGAEPTITDGEICFGTCFPRDPSPSPEPSPESSP